VPERCANEYPELRRVGVQDAACWYPLESADELRRVAQTSVTEEPDVGTTG
jgi:hypothetical protein